MAKAILNGVVIAESDKTIKVEGNTYFPPDTVKMQYFQDSERHTICPWKGVASYYSVEVNGQKVENAAWYYPRPKDLAKHFANYVAFYRERGVIIE